MAEGAEIRLVSAFQEESAIQAKPWLADFFLNKTTISVSFEIPSWIVQ